MVTELTWHLLKDWSHPGLLVDKFYCTACILLYGRLKCLSENFRSGRCFKTYFSYLEETVFNCHCLNTWRGDSARTNELVNSIFKHKDTYCKCFLIRLILKKEDTKIQQKQQTFKSLPYLFTGKIFCFSI